MQLHHDKHHLAYVTNYNIALEKQEEATAKNDIAALIALQPAIKFNGGGKRCFTTQVADLKDDQGSSPK